MFQSDAKLTQKTASGEIWWWTGKPVRADGNQWSPLHASTWQMLQKTGDWCGDLSFRKRRSIKIEAEQHLK